MASASAAVVRTPVLRLKEIGLAVQLIRRTGVGGTDNSKAFHDINSAAICTLGGDTPT